MTLRFSMDGAPKMMKYFLLTMLSFQRDDGFVWSGLTRDFMSQAQ